MQLDITTKKAEKLISLYSEAVEGMIEESRIKYNELIKEVNLNDVLSIALHSPFENHSQQMITILRKNNIDIPSVLLEKEKKNLEYINYISSL